MAQDHSAEKQQRIDLLQLYCRELSELNLQRGEAADLNNEYQRLSHAGQIMQTLADVLDNLFDAEDFNVQQQLSRSLQQLQQLSAIDGALVASQELIQAALIQVQEAATDLHAYRDSIDLDPSRLEWLNQRLGQIQTLARKHQVEHSGDELVELASQLGQELDELTSSEHNLEQLQALRDQALAQYLEAAARLSTARGQTATELSTRITAAMQDLGMAGGKFEIEVAQQSADHYRASGIDQVTFLISANPGQTPRPLSKIASGGELSRMSLAIQVILSQSSHIPTLIFDEVDSGIGGGIAEVVGRRLRAISQQHHQVLCVTHLPQVAAQAHHHLQVIKEKSAQQTLTRVKPLDDTQRLEEIARMLGGMTITDQTRAHAEEMLQSA